jgi:hypothetical protein
MAISITELRANIYNIVDDIIKTGQPVDIERSGKKLRILQVEAQTQVAGKLNKLIARPEAISGSPEDFTHIDWSHEWNP